MTLSIAICRPCLFTVTGWCALLFSGPAFAVPPLLNYQGYLSDGSGPVTAALPMTFELYADSTGGAPLWSESYESVNVAGGVFHVLLGGATPLPLGSLFTGQTLWISTNVDGKLLQPRRPIVSVAYAARAAIADSAIVVPPVIPMGSVVYTRWGRTTCPGGASLVYEGRVGGGNYQQSGSGAQPLCLTLSPQWSSFNDGNQNGGLVYGTEYLTQGYGVFPLGFVHNFEVPCAVCLREDARVSLMIPGTQGCPPGWTAEYAGYLMSPHYTQQSGGYLCVDSVPQGVGNPASQTGHLLYPVEGECGALPCGPYVQDRELTCVVCTRP